ncbi:MAG: hypothetical protein VKK62_01900 [Synechococcaceae cyanobacterium]|nr:hypothetical protein [Synechococcaceae cyanobacterium]
MAAEPALQPGSSRPPAPAARSRQLSTRRLLLVLLTAGIGVFYLVFAWRTFVLHYYPSPPLFYDEGDSLADWLNACAWSERTDRYTKWQSLYTPFSHFTCSLFSAVLGVIPVDWTTGWRQFSLSFRLVLLLHLLLWFSILLPLKPCTPPSAGQGPGLLQIRLRRLPFKLLTLLSYGALYSFERGNLLSLCFLLFLLSFRLAYSPQLHSRLQPLLLGLGAAIKPYMLLFSTYSWRLGGLLQALAVAVGLQLAAVVLAGAPGLENLPANLDYFGRDNDVSDVLTRTLHSFSFKSYLDLHKLVAYGEADTFRADQLHLLLDGLYGLSLALFLLTGILGLQCLRSSWRQQRLRRRQDASSSDPLLSGVIPSCVLVFLYLLQAQASGAYVVLFLIAALLCLEEETGMICRSPLLLSLYFLAICAFDMPWSTAKSFSCGSLSLQIQHRPLLSELLGTPFTCLGTYVGPLSLARPLLTLLFGLALFAHLLRHLRIQERLAAAQSGASAPEPPSRSLPA